MVTLVNHQSSDQENRTLTHTNSSKSKISQCNRPISLSDIQKN